MVVLCRTSDVPESKHVESQISNTTGSWYRHEDCPGNEPERHEYLEHKAHEANEKVGIGTVDAEGNNFRFAAYGGKPADYMCG